MTAATFSIAGSQTVYDFSGATTAANTNATLTLTSQFNESLTGYAQVGQGSTGTIYIYGTGFAYNGSTVTVAAAPAGITFSGASETQLDSSTGYGYVSVSYDATAATPGFYSVTVTDGNGTTTALANAIVVDAAPTVTSVSPATILSSSSAQTITLTGTGFDTNGMTATFTSAVDGTTLSKTSGAGSNSITFTPSSSTSATLSVYALNNVTGAAATPGAYNITVTNNADGATSTANNVLTINSFGFSSASPSFLPINTSAASSYSVTLTGTNLGTSGALLADYGSTATYGGAGNASATGWLTNVAFSNTTITVTVTVPTNVSSAAYLNFELINSAGATVTFNGAIGIGQSSKAAGNAPTVTAVAPAGSSLTIGSAATFVVTGTNFVPTTSGTAASFNVGGTSTNDAALTCDGGFTAASTTTATCVITSITASTIAGPQDLVVTTAAGSGTFASALTVAGPVITSASPSVLGITSSAQAVTLTGTGFPTATSDMKVTIVSGATFTGGALTTDVTATSATSASISFATVTSASVVIKVSSVSGATTTSPNFSFTAGAAPQFLGSNAVTYAANTNGVGVGASNVAVTWSGSGFLPGVTLSFGTTGVSATVTAVTANSITANVSVAAGSTAGLSTVTATNTNGGTTTSSTADNGSLLVTYAPGGVNSAVGSGTTFYALAGSTTTLTFSGGYYQTGMTATAGNALASVGTLALGTTATSGADAPTGSYTTVSVPVTVPTINGTSGIQTTLTLTNADGGSTTYTLNIAMQPTVTGTYYVPTFSNNVQVIITGTGFESGMTATSTNSDYTVLLGQTNPATAPSIVSTAILVVSTTSNATSGTSSNITFTNPDGGTVTFALNGGPVPAAAKKVFKVTAVHGHALTGRTTKLYILGTGFYGRPKVTSNAAGTKALVVKDNGKQLTVRVTVKAGTKKGVHTFTVTLANGQRARIRYIQR